MRVETAVGMLMSRRDIDAETARDFMEQAALRAGVTTEQLAQTMAKGFETPEGHA